MKALLLLLILISYVGTAKTKEECYFTPLNTGIKCKKITHDNTLKECYGVGFFQGQVSKSDVINATNIVKVCE